MPLLSTFGAASSFAYHASSFVPASQIIFSTVTDTTWTVPDGVTKLSVVAVGGGGGWGNISPYGGYSASVSFGAGGGGGVAWNNDFPVIPGEILRVVVADKTIKYSWGGDGGGSTYLMTTSRGAANIAIVWAYGGATANGGMSASVNGLPVIAYGGNYSVATGGSSSGGGIGGKGWSWTDGSAPMNNYTDRQTYSPHGGGAGGYTGRGGNSYNNTEFSYNVNGLGGGGGAGFQARGGGVSLYGQGINGTGYGYGVSGTTNIGLAGSTDKALNKLEPLAFGAGSGGLASAATVPRAESGGGMRIVWAGSTDAVIQFPDNAYTDY